MQNLDGSLLCVQGLDQASPPSAAAGPSYYYLTNMKLAGAKHSAITMFHNWFDHNSARWSKVMPGPHPDISWADQTQRIHWTSAVLPPWERPNIGAGGRQHFRCVVAAMRRHSDNHR
jgi:hypothetical protein